MQGCCDGARLGLACPCGKLNAGKLLMAVDAEERGAGEVTATAEILPDDAETPHDLREIEDATDDDWEIFGRDGRGLRLSTLREIRVEMARVYRGVIAGKLAKDSGTRLTYMLDRIRAVREAEIASEIDPNGDDENEHTYFVGLAIRGPASDTGKSK